MEFGVKIPRVGNKALGRGSMLDIGIYCIQLAQFVFNGDKPSKVVAAGHLNNHGVDECVSGTLIYSDRRMASFQIDVNMDNSGEAVIYGTKGKIKVKYPFWCPNKLEMPDGSEMEFLLPEGKYKFNLVNIGFEAQHVHECIKKGLLESPQMSHAESLMMASIIEDVRTQVGVSYPQDE